jgi:hypothetical protein
VVIVADADEPGQRGATRLSDVLVCRVLAVRIVTPPAGIKDARAWLLAGATRVDVEQTIAAATVRRLTASRKAVQRGR